MNHNVKKGSQDQTEGGHYKGMVVIKGLNL